MRRVVVAVLVGVAAVAAAGCGSDGAGVSGEQTLRMARVAWSEQWPDDEPCRVSSREWAGIVADNSSGDDQLDAAMLLVHVERCGE